MRDVRKTVSDFVAISVFSCFPVVRLNLILMRNKETSLSEEGAFCFCSEASLQVHSNESMQ